MDIDLDFQSTFDPRSLFKTAIPASMVKNNTLVKHQCGHYFQTMPIDKVTGYAAIPYEPAKELGFFKIDFLHLGLLDTFRTKSEMRQLLNKEPNWELLLDRNVVSKLFHIHSHFDLVAKIKPQSVEELADCLALIRPAKRHLIDTYLTNKQVARRELYVKTSDKYYFKRSHAISYALTIVLQLHMVAQGRL